MINEQGVPVAKRAQSRRVASANNNKETPIKVAAQNRDKRDRSLPGEIKAVFDTQP